MIANCDSSIALKRLEIDFPLSSPSSSLKVIMPFRFKAAYKWSVKFLRVSWPLKLRNTSYFHWRVEGEGKGESDGDGDGDGDLLRFIESVGNLDKRSTTN